MSNQFVRKYSITKLFLYAAEYSHKFNPNEKENLKVIKSDIKWSTYWWYKKVIFNFIVMLYDATELVTPVTQIQYLKNNINNNNNNNNNDNDK